MDPLVTITLLFGILAALIAGVGSAKSSRGRAIYGLAALVWAGFMFAAARMVETFNLNAWYSASAHNLLDAAADGIDAGHGDQVSKRLAAMRDELHVTYENRGNFKELAEKTTADLKALGDGQKGEDVPNDSSVPK